MNWINQVADKGLSYFLLYEEFQIGMTGMLWEERGKGRLEPTCQDV